MEVREDEAGGLLVVVHSEDGDEDDEEGAYVPQKYAARYLVQQVRANDVRGTRAEGDEIGDEDNVPAFNGIRVWVTELGHS